MKKIYNNPQDANKAYRKRNPEKVKLWEKKRREKRSSDLEAKKKWNEYHKQYRKRNKEKFNEEGRKKNKKIIQNLPDFYINGLLSQMLGIPRKKHPKELVDIKRKQLTLKRLCKLQNQQQLQNLKNLENK